MTAQRVDDLGALTDQEVARSEDHGRSLLRLALHGHEPHRWTLGCFADRLSIGHIVLLAFNERLHVRRRISRTSWPSSPIARAQWCALAHASIATTQRGWPAKKVSTCARLSFLRKTTAPDALAPCAWNTCLARSRPMVLTSSTDASLWWSSTPPPWHVDAVGGRPPHHWKTTTFMAGLRADRV